MCQKIILFIFIKFFAFIIHEPVQKNNSINRIIAFYNVENLFDTINDPDTYDEDYTPSGKNQYSSQDYFQKISNISRVISEIGNKFTEAEPAIVGLAEVENFQVLKELVLSKKLKGSKYQIIHHDSPDQRGIDVALIYQENVFHPIDTEFIELKLWTEKGDRLYTRDILYVKGILDNEILHIFVNHWPSRRGGKSRSNPKRVKAAYLVKKKLDEIFLIDPNSKIIILGDFNDDPKDNSIKQGLLKPSKTELASSNFLFNPMKKMYQKGMNTLAYRDGIHLFDQIIISSHLLNKENTKPGFVLHAAGIYNPSYLITQNGKYKGYPFRSFQNNRFAGGYSDHFPVFMEIKKNIRQ